MAEGWSTRPLCRFYARGACAKGSYCFYSHESSPVEVTGNVSEANHNSNNKILRSPCKYFLRGMCLYGTSCRFSHSQQTESTYTDHRLHSIQPTTSSESAVSSFFLPGTSKKLSAIRNYESSADSGLGEDPSDSWVYAPEFVPTSPSKLEKAKTYAEALYPANMNIIEKETALEIKLCPYMMNGKCEYEMCQYVHGDICDLCGCAVLNPVDSEQRKKHISECIRQHEVDMELSFAIARSKDKTCGVCFEIVMDKKPGDTRFGILPNCNHCFCLSCIRKWRQETEFDSKIIRACPECRVTSDFVCPSTYWVDTKEEKDKLIQDYKIALSTKNCKYFNSGAGKCPFGNKCFYLHAYPDGTIADVGPPVRIRRRKPDELDVLQQLILWDWLDDRENRFVLSFNEMEGTLSSDSSEESDWSDYEITI